MSFVVTYEHLRDCSQSSMRLRRCCAACHAIIEVVTASRVNFTLSHVTRARMRLINNTHAFGGRSKCIQRIAFASPYRRFHSGNTRVVLI